MESVRSEVRDELNGVLYDLRKIKGKLDFDKDTWLIVWRIFERLEYLAFMISQMYELEDYSPSFQYLNRVESKDLSSLLTQCLDEALKALEKEEIKKTYSKVKESGKILAILLTTKKRST